MNKLRRHPPLAVLIDLIVGAYLIAATGYIILPKLFSEWLGTFNIGFEILYWAVFYAAIGTTGASVGLLYVKKKFEEGKAGTTQRNILWGLLSITIVAGWIVTDISPIEFFSSDGLKGAGRIFGALLTPELNVVGVALKAMVETVFTAFMATIAAVPVAFVLSFPAARNIMSGSVRDRSIYSALRAFLNITRSMEPIIWAIIFSVWVGIGPFAGMLALVVHTIASLTKQYSEQIEDVNDGPIEAISATGATRLQVLWFAIVPQCVIPFLSFTIFRWDINVRMATIIGFVGGGGIGTLLTQYQGLSKFHEVGTLVIIITLVVWLLDIVSSKVRAALK